MGETAHFDLAAIERRISSDSLCGCGHTMHRSKCFATKVPPPRSGSPKLSYCGCPFSHDVAPRPEDVELAAVVAYARGLEDRLGPLEAEHETVAKVLAAYDSQQIEAKLARLPLLEQAARVRVAMGHDGECAYIIGDAQPRRPCDCGHDALVAALGGG
jgi:hypothetical protein